MPWVHKTGSCTSTIDMLSQLYDWVTGSVVDGVSPFPPARYFTPGLKEVTPSVAAPGKIAVSVRPGLNNCGKWAVGLGAENLTKVVTDITGSPESLRAVSRERMTLYRLGRDGGDYWVFADNAFIGGSNNFRNIGFFGWFTKDTGTAADDFTALWESSFSYNHSGNSVQRASAVYPSYGADTFHFFTDGDCIHVAFRRVAGGSSSWQHFSFGLAEKPAGSNWEGGEYFSGSAAADSILQWNKISNYAFTQGCTHLLNSHGNLDALFNGGIGGMDPHPHGFIRAEGATACNQQNYAVPCNYAAIGAPMFSGGGDITHSAQYYDAFALAGVVGAASNGTQVAYADIGVEGGSLLGALELTPNSWNGRSPGYGVELYIADPDSNRWRYLAKIPGVRFLNVENLEAEQIVNSDWIVFPLSNKVTANAEHSDSGHTCSANYGVAYRKS